jgi:sugar lactone lactonase YvrE
VRYAHDGVVSKVVDLPIQEPTGCAFVGPDLRMFCGPIASHGLDEAAQPRGGCVLRLNVCVADLPSYRLAD